MQLKMLASMAGNGFALSVGEITDRFTKKEAKRLIDAGYAEPAPVVEPKKPATKAEWDDERAKLLAENEALWQRLADAQAREETLVAEISGLAALKATVVAALGVTETATHPPAEETRG